jgi:hypothetical protein
MLYFLALLAFPIALMALLPLLVGLLFAVSSQGLNPADLAEADLSEG